MACKRVCGKCGSELSSVGAEQLCPGCLLEAGLETSHDGSESSSGGREGPLPIEPPFPRSFGDYELLEEIARGGMGVVYKARQVSLDRIVAVKMLLFGTLAGPEFVQRFRTEAAAAASLQHPNIVAIHEVGFREGQHFFAMDYVAGRSLAQIVRDGPLPARRAAGYVKIIAEAIQYAHERGILHRDLKPSNVLIDESDQPRVTDFGLAKRLEKETDLTLSGQVLGSPDYMAPEQAAAQRGQVGKRSDVYSLGAILYHLLTGQPPFVAMTVGETLEQVRNVEPTSPRVSDPHLARDLETICLKCLEKEPQKRYATAEVLAEDLGRFLYDEPIQARPVSTPEKLWRWCRRKPVIATLSATTVLLLLAVAIGSLIAAYRIERERNIAQGRLYAAQMKLAHAAWRDGKVGGALELLRAQPPEFRGFDWRYVFSLCLASESPNEVLATNASGFTAVDYSPDQRTVALGTGDGSVEVYDAQSRQRVKRWSAHSGPLDDLAFHPTNANWLATVSGDDGLLKLWDVAKQRALLSTNGPKRGFAHVAFSPRGNILASGAPDGASVNFWEFEPPTTATPALTLKTNLNLNVPLVVAFAPDNQSVALCNVGAMLNGVALYDLTNGRMIRLPDMHSDLIISAAFSLDGNLLATGGADEQVVVWDTKKQTPIRTNMTELVNVTSLVFAPDGQSLFASGWDQNLLCWDLASLSEPITLRGHGAAVNALAMSGSGSSLVSAGRDGTARLWDLRGKDTTAPSPIREGFSTLLSADKSLQAGQEAVFAVAVSPTQDKLAAGTPTKIFLFDLATGSELASAAWNTVFDGEGANASFGLAFSPDGKTLAIGSGIGTLALVDADTLKRLKPLTSPHTQQILRTAFALNGTVLVTGGGFGDGVAISDAASGRVLTKFAAIEGSFPGQPLDVSRNGQLLAVSSPEQFVIVRDLASGQVVARCPQKVRFLHAVAFSPDAKLVAYSDELGGIFLWDVSGQRPLRTLVGHRGPALDLAFSPDGRTLASASMDHTIKLWHPEIEQEVATLEGHSGWVWCIAFGENGKALVSGSRDGTLKLWQAASFDEIKANEMITRPNP